MATTDASDKIASLELTLAHVQAQSLSQSATLDAIMRQLALLTPAPLIHTPTASIVAPTTDTPKTSQIKPATPSEFDGDRTKGRTFLNSCRLYINLCGHQFADEQAKIHWALSYMKSGRAAAHANRTLRSEARTGEPMYSTWKAFETAFVAAFCPKNEAVAALTRLESTRYYQGKRSVDEYIDEFDDLVDEAGYTDGLAIVMKFRRGLDRQIQDRIAELGMNRPSDNDPEEWYEAARLFDQNRAANEAFHATARSTSSQATKSFFSITRPVGEPLLVPKTPATPATNRLPITAEMRPVGVCHRCQKPGHYAKQCPLAHDVRYMSMDEKQDLLEQLLAEKDVADSQIAKVAMEEESEETEGFQRRSG
jgi:hypothetical protein